MIRTAAGASPTRTRAHTTPRPVTAGERSAVLVASPSRPRRWHAPHHNHYATTTTTVEHPCRKSRGCKARGPKCVYLDYPTHRATVLSGAPPTRRLALNASRLRPNALLRISLHVHICVPVADVGVKRPPAERMGLGTPMGANGAAQV